MHNLTNSASVKGFRDFGNCSPSLKQAIFCLQIKDDSVQLIVQFLRRPLNSRTDFRVLFDSDV